MESNQKNNQARIECPNTIFQLYLNSEDDLNKIEIFMNNIRGVKQISLVDIYNWCNRQGISYDTSFNYHRELSILKNIQLYFNYYRQKRKYQKNIQSVS